MFYKKIANPDFQVGGANRMYHGFSHSLYLEGIYKNIKSEWLKL